MCGAAATELEDFTEKGIQWGDGSFHMRFEAMNEGDADFLAVGQGSRFRHAGFSSKKIGEIVPAELYAGRY